MKRVLHLAMMIGVAAAPACVVRGSGAVVAPEATVTVSTEPPPPQVETVEMRPGFVWVKGHYVWMNGQWTWTGGHWERERAGYAWTEGRWERRGNGWFFVDGTWAVSSTPVVAPQGGVTVTASSTTTTTYAPPPDNSGMQGGVSVTVGAFPTAEPPPLQVETVQPRAGFVWITGRWDWRGGRWEWVGGHWERERANQIWIAGRWERRGNRFEWVEGRWEAGAAPAGPVIRDHRH
jgi:hypothetical protein